MPHTGRDRPAPKQLWRLAWVPASAGMTVFVEDASSTPTVIPTKVGTHASFSAHYPSRSREEVATEPERNFFNNRGCGSRFFCRAPRSATHHRGSVTWMPTSVGMTESRGGVLHNESSGPAYKTISEAVRSETARAGDRQFRLRETNGLSSEKAGMATLKMSPCSFTIWYEPTMMPCGVRSGQPDV